MKSKDKLGEIVNKLVINHDIYRKSKYIAVYLSMPNGEILTNEIVNDILRDTNKKKCYVPKMFNNEIKMLNVVSLEELQTFPKDNKFKIPEPPLDTNREDGKYCHFIVN